MMMSYLSRQDDIMVYFYLPVFSIVPKHIKWPFLTKRVIHELSEEVMNFSHFTTFDFDVPLKMFEPWDDWGNEYEKLLQVLDCKTVGFLS